ncbi:MULTISPECIES: P-loop NTPase family protein [Bacillus]|uniref:Uncharacterized protein n=2 Tax=Bacillus TaxID=1386 RepID=A0A0M4G0V1_9BACI|nr:MULTISPECIES: hypothetical protein [Bacillus]ALC83788.1 hypothetical protein AM592_21405 [Bacillus gobiensis]MBP1084014.1 ABC-2 type transport system ATP-binding protein [Bacillus capparidis]MED1096938.1 hypothetical protein [Bacillus capparidis]
MQLPPIDLEIKKGACIAIKCNKDMGYTLIQLLLKKDTSSGGEIRFSNEKIKIGRSLLDEELYDSLTVKQYLTFFSSLYGVKADLGFALEATSLLDKVVDKISILTFSEKRHFI